MFGLRKDGTDNRILDEHLASETLPLFLKLFLKIALAIFDFRH